MRFSAFVRCTVSLGAFILAAQPAIAQDASQTPDEGQPLPEAQDTPADNTEIQQEADAQEAGEENGIVVTGIRESLQSTRNLRRNSDQIVDAVVAEDIGKLPDLAVSDTAARIPGVQVVRTGGEASRVLVRGLPDFATTYNGREIFTAETRVVALQDFPSANIAALEVFKTSTANLVEPGLAGLVNVRSRRPFDFREGQISASVWGLYSVQSEKLAPNINALLTDRWEVGDGDIGLLLNFSYTELNYLDSEPSNTDFIADPVINGQRVRFPDIQRLFYRSGNRVRPSANAAFQYRPNDKFEFYVEGLWQGFRNKVDDRLVAVPLYGGGSYTNLVFRPGTNQLSSGTINGLADPIFTFQGGTYNQTDTFQFAAGGIFENGPLRIAVDVARTDTTFTGSTESVDRIFRGQGGTSVDFNLEVPEFRIRNFDPNQIDNFLFDGLYEEQQESSGQDWQGRIDAEYTFEDLGFLRSLELGFRYTDRQAHREFGNRFAGFRGRNIPSSSLPLQYQLTPPGFAGTDVQSGFRSFLSPTFTSIRENRALLRQFVLNNAPFGGFGTFTTEAPTAPTLFDAAEETMAGYGQLNFGFGEWLEGIIGVRGVNTKVQVTGGTPGPIAQFNSGSEFFDLLPNASLRIRATPQLQIRLSATQTRTRPNFSELNPSGSLGQAPTNCNPAGDPFNCARRGNTGNPFLQPFTSDNYDASVEYYFSRTGFASATVFRRNLFGFIQNRDVRITDPTLGPIIINQPVNTGEGRIDGAEFQIQTFFDFGGVPEFLNNFGIQANVTYLDAKTGFPNANGTTTLDQIIGVSEWSYNVVGLYENGPLSARLTYNQRSEYIDRRDNRGDDLYLEYAQPGDRLDFSLNYNIMENATVFFDWTNILMEPFGVELESGRAGATRTQYQRFLRFEESTLSLGLRFRL
ncbi:MAG TPA: TonB-dependent receptor [Allosphingosinicella sp.]|nr:TonB-dependent receptor [Allosphingosinicella sp.]